MLASAGGEIQMGVSVALRIVFRVFFGAVVDQVLPNLQCLLYLCVACNVRWLPFFILVNLHKQLTRIVTVSHRMKLSSNTLPGLSSSAAYHSISILLNVFGC